MKGQKHSHILITGLVYPAFLGAFLYEVAQKLSELTILQIVLSTALILVFANDYLYTTDVKRKEIYNKGRAFFDFVIVLLLYLSLRNALTTEITLSYIWFYMFSFKLASLLWELWGTSDKQKLLAINLYIVFFFLYFAGFIIELLLSKSIILALIIVVIADGLAYIFWERLSRLFGKKSFFGSGLKTVWMDFKGFKKV